MSVSSCTRPSLSDLSFFPRGTLLKYTSMYYCYVLEMYYSVHTRNLLAVRLLGYRL